MWGLFFCAALVGAVFLYIPGFLVLRGFRASFSFAFAFAPLIGIPATVAITFVYSLIGVQSSWASVLFPQLAFGVILFLLGKHRAASSRESLFAEGDRVTLGFDPRSLLLYVAVGIAVSSVMFVSFLQEPISFAQEYDNVVHLGSIRSFVESGNWSPFGTSLYVGDIDSGLNPLPGTGFYPPVWYDVAAFMVSMLGVPIVLSVNAANFVFAGIVFPIGVFAFMSVVFEERCDVVRWGAACALAFSAFPWMTIAWGPLFPNTAAFCLAPLVAALFVLLFREGLPARSRIGFALLFVAGVVALAFTQPNAVFTVGVWLVPFLAYRVSFAADLVYRGGRTHRGLRVLFAVAALVAVGFIWFAAYCLPFLQAVVQHSWIAVQSKPQAFASALTLGFMSKGTQLALMVFVIIGAALTLKSREWLWLSFAFAIACGLFVVDVSSDGPLQHLLTGFWYTDYYRVAAMAAMFGIPLASLGIAEASSRISALLARLRHAEVHLSSVVSVALCFVLLLAGNVISIPMVSDSSPEGAPRLGKSSFCSVWQQLYRENNVDYIYTTEEKEFVKEAKQLIPDGALVINNPNDGSCFCYVVDDIRVYYRYLRAYGEGGESEDSELIRSRLDMIAHDERVNQAVRNVGAEYVLLLDQGRENDPADPDSFFFFTYERKGLWSGIDLVSDTTPGFEVVLSRNDMRLYRITAIEE